MNKIGFHRDKETSSEIKDKKKSEKKTEEIKPVYDDPILQGCYSAGYLGFDKQYLISVLDIPDKTIREEFEIQEGIHYTAFIKGFFTAQIELRAQLMRNAKNGSSMAQALMLSYFAGVDDDLNE